MIATGWLVIGWVGAVLDAKIGAVIGERTEPIEGALGGIIGGIIGGDFAGNRLVEIAIE